MSDPLAALTLGIVRCVEMPVDAAAPPCRWMVVATSSRELSWPAKLERLGAVDGDAVMFETTAGRATLAVAAFRARAASYLVTSCGVTVTPGAADASALRQSILRADHMPWCPRGEGFA